ncbi:MAG: hypothetical protein P9X22_07990 [Candidatus Zapsychrus exili]|nr:hypothetical protein [Candidatus Zapsychrus exili]
MKKIVILLIVIVFSCIVASPAHSMLRKDRDFFVGEVIAVNEETKEITIVDYNSRVERIFVIERGWANAVIGNEVMINALKGTKVAKNLRKISRNNSDQIKLMNR